MEYRRVNDLITLRIDKGEEIVSTIKTVCEKEEVKLGTFTGIGAVGEITLGVFRTDTKEYIKTDLSGTFEITSLLGNISTMNGDVYIHPHVTVSDESLMVKGGHLNRAIVSATCEISIKIAEGQAERRFSEEIGLNLYHFE